MKEDGTPVAIRISCIGAARIRTLDVRTNTGSGMKWRKVSGMVHFC